MAPSVARRRRPRCCRAARPRRAVRRLRSRSPPTPTDRRSRPERAPLQPVRQRSRRTVAGCARRRIRRIRCSGQAQGASRGTGSSIVPTPLSIRDAHTLYIEMLAELGPFGLALILAVFGFPLVLACVRGTGLSFPSRQRVLVAYLARAGIDWDWEFPVLTLVALACASVIVAEAEVTTSEPIRWQSGRARSRPSSCSCHVAAVVTLGNRAEAAAADAFDARDFERSATEAERAERLAPWSVEPLVLLGRAQAAGVIARGGPRDLRARRRARARPLAGLVRARGSLHRRRTQAGLATGARAEPARARTSTTWRKVRDSNGPKVSYRPSPGTIGLPFPSSASTR